MISIIDTWSMNMPSRISTRNIAVRITSGARSKPVAQPTSPRAAPDSASIWLNTVEFIRMKNTMPPVRTVAISEVVKAFQVNTRRATARITTPSTPNDADSDGVAHPRMMKPITMKTTRLMGRTLTQTSYILLRHVVGSTS